MAKAGRPKSLTGPRVRWDFYIRADIAAEVDLILADPTRARVKYGARSDLVEKLLGDWLESVKKEPSVLAK